MITLIIVDCQNDYITGTVLIKGAKELLENIKKFIKNRRKEIEKIIFAIEWHPYNHMSFKKYGGNYPHHCVQFTPGACIEPKLLKFVQSLEIDYEVSSRGEIEEVDQLGAFDLVEISSDSFPKQKYYFDSIATANTDTDFVVCGINSIKSTIENLIRGEIHPKVFVQGTILDGINEFMKENQLEKIV